MSWGSLYLQRKKPGVREVKQFAKGKRKQILVFESGVCWVVITASFFREGGRGSGRLVSAVTQRARAELVPSRPVVGLHPAPTAPSRVPEVPHLGWRPLTWALTSLCAAPSSPFSLLGPEGCGRCPLRPPTLVVPGAPGLTPAGPPESRAEP